MFHIVLVEPEIPQNTGNIARTSAATGCTLHLVKPLGFEISDKQVKRAGLDYWSLVKVIVHESFDEVLSEAESSARFYYFTTKAPRASRRQAFEKGTISCSARRRRGSTKNCS